MPDKPILDDKTARMLPWLVATSFFMQMLDGTILNTALPAIARNFGENPLRMQAVIISYMLTSAVCIPASGWLTDRVGPRRLMIASIGLFTLGSLLCAASFSLKMMVIARIVQGVGGALMVPVGRLVILRMYPKADLVRVLSIITIPGLFGSLIGPALGGSLVQYASWHWIFLINLPVGFAGMIITKKLMPVFEVDREHPFDIYGFVVFALSLVLISLALETLSTHRQTAAILGALGLFVQIYYWARLATREVSLFKRSIFRTSAFSVGLAANLFTRLGVGSTPFLLPLLLQVVLGYSPLMAGLLMMPMAMASVCAKLLAKPLANHFKYRSVLLFNTIMQGLLISSLSLVGMELKPVIFCLQLFFLGGINSLQFSFMNSFTLMDLPYEHSGGGNALISVLMQLSQSLAVSMAAAILFFFQGSAVIEPGMDMTHALSAFHYTFMVVGATSAVSALIFFFGPKK